MSRFIIADANKCIGCHTCEVACVVSHQDNQDYASLTLETFLPRIHVIKGVNISTATLCRQCEDAPCANVYPNGAISRDKGFVHVMQKCCIGCKTRVVACPYGAMEVVVHPVVCNSGAGLNVRAEKAKANKCNLCHHRGASPACMEVCPAHALIYVDHNKLEQLSTEKRRRAALDSTASLLFRWLKIRVKYGSTYAGWRLCLIRPAVRVYVGLISVASSGRPG